MVNVKIMPSKEMGRICFVFGKAIIYFASVFLHSKGKFVKVELENHQHNVAIKTQPKFLVSLSYVFSPFAPP